MCGVRAAPENGAGMTGLAAAFVFAQVAGAMLFAV